MTDDGDMEQAPQRLGMRFPAGDRPAHYPGGMECFNCGCIFIGAADHKLCRVCEEETPSATAQRLGYM
jgi:hypothetical protein